MDYLINTNLVISYLLPTDEEPDEDLDEEPEDDPDEDPDETELLDTEPDDPPLNDDLLLPDEELL